MVVLSNGQIMVWCPKNCVECKHTKTQAIKCNDNIWIPNRYLNDNKDKQGNINREKAAKDFVDDYAWK